MTPTGVAGPQSAYTATARQLLLPRFTQAPFEGDVFMAAVTFWDSIGDVKCNSIDSAAGRAEDSDV